MLELFSLGEGHYSERDVREAARARSTPPGWPSSPPPRVTSPVASGGSGWAHRPHPSGWRQQELAIQWLLQAIDTSPEAIASRQQGLRLADQLEELSCINDDAQAISLRGRRAMC